MTGHPFAFRAPWYARERDHTGLRDAAALRPVLQKYDSTRFVSQVTEDPRESLKFVAEDQWSYPMPVAFPAPGKGRERFATSKLVRTRLRKLYQPNHDRFYVVVVELFCDTPGLPRAGGHDDVQVQFVLRRRQTDVDGAAPEVRRLARELLLDLQRPARKPPTDGGLPRQDLEDIWWAEAAARERFLLDHGDLITAVKAHVREEGWLVDKTNGSGRWSALGLRSDTLQEELHPMWRLPDEAADCDPARSRSLWFGVVPTYSAEHWLPDPAGRAVPKLDEHAVYEIRTVVTEKPLPGHEKCPPKRSYSVPSEPFRFAAPYDPEGTKNRRVTISAPDFRTLAARAGLPPGPGGLVINTPPGSQMKFNPFSGVPKPGAGSLGAGGVCTFAFELFFIVALFLFLMFLPIVVFVFQLWWMLALRFCFPRLSASMTVLNDFFATANVGLLAAAAAKAEVNDALSEVFGVDLEHATDAGVATALAGTGFAAVADDLLADAVVMVAPEAVPPVEPAPPLEPKPADPLCALSGAGD